MELKYPIILKIGIPALVIAGVLFHLIKRKVAFRGGIRAANTEFVRELPEYRSYHIKQIALRCILEVAIFTSIIASLILIARPVKTETVSNGTKKRDIYLNLDVSYSICYLNYDLVDNLEDVVRSLDGDRFGISIYNTSTVLYVPMTDDYDFIIRKLEELKRYFQLQKEYMAYYPEFNVPKDELEHFYEVSVELDYLGAGTLIDNMRKGSSLIGEGLASCLYSFPHIEDENRTRIIIMSTDNAQEERAKPIVELDEACNLCGKNKVTVFGIFPNEDDFTQASNDYYYDYDYDKLANQMKKAVESTGGRFYKQSKTMSVKDIVKDIQQQKVMEVNEITIKKLVDKPVIPAVILIISIIIIIIVGAVILI